MGGGWIAKIMIMIVGESSYGAKNSAKVGKEAKKVSSWNLALASFFLTLCSPSSLYYRSLYQTNEYDLVPVVGHYF